MLRGYRLQREEEQRRCMSNTGRQAGSDIRHGRRRGDPHRVEVEVVVLRGHIDRLEVVISIRRSTDEKRERK